MTKHPGLSRQVTITAEHRKALRDQFKRTGLTAIRLLLARPDAPEGVSSSHINRWMSGILRQADAAHLEYVLAELKSLPDYAAQSDTDGQPYSRLGRRPESGASRMELTSDMSRLLRSELARTALDHATLLDSISDVPAGLNARIIRGWLYQDAGSVDAGYWQFVMTYLEAQPDFTGTLPPLTRKRTQSTS